MVFAVAFLVAFAPGPMGRLAFARAGLALNRTPRADRMFRLGQGLLAGPGLRLAVLERS